MATREGGEGGGESDFIEHLFTASTHDYLMFFTNTGRVYTERVHEIPDMGRAAKGRSIANLLELKSHEKIAALIRIVQAGRTQIADAVVEVLRQLLDDLRFTRGAEPERRQARPELARPVRHDRLR